MENKNTWAGKLFLFGLLALGMAFATTDYAQIQSGICQLYVVVTTLLAAVVFVLIVLAAIVYAAGQVMGAETRARASVWATSMIVGAVIGIVIYVVVPIVLDAMLTESITTACG